MSKALTVRTTDLDVMSVGKILAQSGFFSDARQEAQAIVKVIAGAELGFGPVASMTGIHIIKGKVSLSANLMAAAVMRSGRYTYRVRKNTREVCEIEFFDGSESIGKSEFTMQDAKDAGLAGDNWKKYPRNMLFARAMSNGVKWFCPDVTGGPVYTGEELGAVVDGETGEIIDVTPEESPALKITEEAVSEAMAQTTQQGTTFGALTQIQLETIRDGKLPNGKPLVVSDEQRQAAEILLHKDAAPIVEYLKAKSKEDSAKSGDDTAEGEIDF